MKILYVTTISNTVNAFLIPHIKMLINEGHQVDIAFNIEEEVNYEIYELGCKIHPLPFRRSPFKSGNFKAYRVLKNIIVSEGYDLVHTHTPVASAVVRLACRKLSSVKVYYTAHGFHFFKGAPIHNWLIYYPVEKWLAKYTDTIITINKEDYERANNKFKAKRVEYIPGVGIDLKKFNTVKIDRYLKRSELGVPKDAFVVLSVGELNKNKNHEVIIKAISKISNSHIHYLICGEGKLDEHLRNLSKELKIENQVHLLGFRKDIAEISKVSDVFAFPSKREGLGLAAIEAMACGLPIITSNIHGIVDYSINRKTGFTNKSDDLFGFAKSIMELFVDREQILEYGRYNLSIVLKYDLNCILFRLQGIYECGRDE